ncbi:MAG: PRC-barrel domain-containing protein [Bacillota bacterium]|nr:PRC-barrel domain-containing protein [Bacillota bacterium]
MRKGREIIGLPVLNLATGKEIGFVQDLVWCPEACKLTYIILEEVGILCRPRFIRYQDVVNVGKDAITVSGEMLPEGEINLETSPRATRVTGVPVITTEGENLGTIEDVVFTLPGGELLGYEISAGLVEDLISGRSILPRDDVVAWGKDTIIVKGAVLEPRSEKNAVSYLPE